METIAWCLEPSQKPQLLRQGMKMEIFAGGQVLSILQMVALVTPTRNQQMCTLYSLQSTPFIAKAPLYEMMAEIKINTRRWQQPTLQVRRPCDGIAVVRTAPLKLIFLQLSDFYWASTTAVHMGLHQSKYGPGLVVIIAIVVSVSIVAVGRQKRQQAEMSVAIKKSDLETDGKAAIYINEDQRADIYKNEDQRAYIYINEDQRAATGLYINEDQGTSLNQNAGSTFPIYINDSFTEVAKSSKSDAKNFETLASDYCELKGSVAAERIQSDGEYEQLDHGKNYEPTIVYEQL